MVFQGLNKTSETTSLLGGNFLKHTKNFVPIINGIEVREGIVPIHEDLTNATKTIAPMDIAWVTIGAVDMLLILSTMGEVHAVIPEIKNRIYSVARRWYNNNEFITCYNSNDQEVPTRGKIITTGNNIYVITNRKCWAIKADGFCYFYESTGNTGFMFVDAFDATIYDVDEEIINIWRNKGYSSMLKYGTRLGYRVRNEFGGRGSMSQTLSVPKADGYVVAGVDGMRQDVFGVHSPNGLSTDIIAWGSYERTTAIGPLTVLDYIVNVDAVSAQYLVGQKIGILDNAEWSNAEVYAVVKSDDFPNKSRLRVTIDNNFGIGDNYAYFEDTEYTYTDSFSKILLNVIGINADGKAFLFYEGSGFATLFAKGKLFNIPKISSAYIDAGTSYDLDRKETNWVIEIVDSPTSFPNTTYPLAFQPTDTAIITASGSLLIAFADYSADSAVCYASEINIHGDWDSLEELKGSRIRYLDTASVANNDYSSWSFLVPSFATDSTGTPCIPTIFTKPFSSIPDSSTTTIACEASVAGQDLNFWHCVDYANTHDTAVGLPALQVSVELGLKIADDGLAVYDKNYESNFNIEPYTETLVVYYETLSDTETVDTKVDFKKYYDIYRIGNDYDFWIGGSDLNYRNIFSVAGEMELPVGTTCGAWLGSGTQVNNQMVHPVLLSKINIYASAVAKQNIVSIGDFDAVCYHNNRFYSALNGVVKVGNPLLEFDPGLTILVNGIVKEMYSTSLGVLVLTTKDVQIIDEKLMVRPFISFPVVKICVVSNQSVLVGEDGHVYITGYKRYGAESVSEQTSDYNLVVNRISDVIVDVVENWNIYDIVYFQDNFYFSTSIGVYVYYSKTNTWWRMDYPIDDIYKFIIYKDQLIVYSGDFDNTVWSNVENGLS